MYYFKCPGGRDKKRYVTTTGGPPLTRKPLARFPLPRFLAYLHASGDFSVSRGLQCSPTNTNFMYITQFFPSPRMSVRRGPSVHTFTFVEMVVTRAAESTRSLVEDDNWGVVGDVAMMIIEELLCSLKCQENLSKFLFHTVISSFFRFCLNILTMSTFNNLQV